MRMNLIVGGYHLSELTQVNVLLGKNGCGKSTLLKAIETALANDAEFGLTKYVTPERGGALIYEPNVDNNITTNATWMPETRRRNQAAQFRQQSVVQFRRLELRTLRESEANKEIADFQPQVDLLNSLLDNVEIRRDGQSFAVHSRATAERLDTQGISSGESELISLGIEVLMFGHEVEADKDNLLFLDEPDVHLHPDLQTRFTAFLTDAVDTFGFTVLMATHSTAMLSGLSKYDGASVSFMKTGDTALAFEPVSDVHRRVLPVFGAHPLSNVFNTAPVLIVEGDDDVRIWQQAVRTSQGGVSLYPVPCDTVSAIGIYEKDVARIIDCVYDGARAFSLRDGDGSAVPLDDLPPVIRMRLGCRAAENLLLTDEVLASVGLAWPEVVAAMEQWILGNPTHVRNGEMAAFQAGGFDRKLHDLKELRMLLVGAILSSSKPWEILVGQVIGDYVHPAGAGLAAAGSLADFLGEKAVTNLCRQA
jgi:predicted ATPase